YIVGIVKFVSMVELLVANPLKSVEFVMTLLYVINVKAAPAAIGVVLFRAFATGVRVVPIASFEPSKVSSGQGSTLFGDFWNVSSVVVDPSSSRGIALGEEEHISVSAFSVRAEGASGATKHGVNFAVLHKYFEDFTGLVGKKDVVRNDYCCSAAGLEDGQDMLNEVELLVADLHDEVLATWGLVGALGSKRWVGEHDVPTLVPPNRVDGVTERDVRPHLV